MTRKILLAAAALGALSGAGGFAADLTAPRITIPPPEPGPTPEPPPSEVVERLEVLAAAADATDNGPITAAGETRLRGSEHLPATAKLAAAMVAENGGSPRAQIDAARATVGKSLVYLPHVGRKQREKALARMAKAAEKAARRDGV